MSGPPKCSGIQAAVRSDFDSTNEGAFLLWQAAEGVPRGRNPTDTGAAEEEPRTPTRFRGTRVFVSGGSTDTSQGIAGADWGPAARTHVVFRG